MCVSIFIRLRLSLGPMYTRSLVHTCSLKYTQAHRIHMLTVYVYVYTLVRTIAHVYERTHTLVRTITCTHTLVCNHLYTLWYVWHVHMTSCSDIHTPACTHWFIQSPVHMRICMSCIYIWTLPYVHVITYVRYSQVTVTCTLTHGIPAYMCTHPYMSSRVFICVHWSPSQQSRPCLRSQTSAYVHACMSVLMH